MKSRIIITSLLRFNKLKFFKFEFEFKFKFER